MNSAQWMATHKALNRFIVSCLLIGANWVILAIILGAMLAEVHSLAD